MRLYLFLFFLLSTFSCSDYDLLIRNVQLIDIESGSIRTKDVLITDSLIVRISASDSSSYKAKRIIDGTGAYLIPGLWDMHVHIQDSAYFRMFLDHGIIGVRDMGGCISEATDGCESLCPEFLNKWKAEIQGEKMDGPHLYLAGSQLSGTGWPSALAVLSKEEVQTAFQTKLEEEADFLKVYEKIPWESYLEISRLAKIHGLDFVGHVSEPFLLTDILDLGQKSIEHMREPLLYSFTRDSLELEEFMIADEYTAEDREFVKPWIVDAENVIPSFKKNKAWFTPTMAVQYARLRFDDKAWIHHPLRSDLAVSVTQGMQKHMDAMRNSTDQKGDSLWWMALEKLVKRFSEEGIGILAGSDVACEGGIPGYSLHEELILMVEGAGLSPLQAVQTATLNPCRYFALERRGTIKENHFADLLLLAENPLQDIRNISSIKAVIKDGQILRSN